MFNFITPVSAVISLVLLTLIYLAIAYNVTIEVETTYTKDKK
jgi:hypothetical protein